jgi:hypothetical protein
LNTLENYSKKKQLETLEYPKYDWVVNGFYRQLLIPKNLKNKLIFFVNRHHPSIYPAYVKLKKRLVYEKK